MIVGSALIALVVVGLAIALLVKAEAKKQFKWQRVHGTVTRSAVELSSTYVPVVEYQYVHDGTFVRADRIRTLSVGFGWRGPAERVVRPAIFSYVGVGILLSAAG